MQSTSIAGDNSNVLSNLFTQVYIILYSTVSTHVLNRAIQTRIGAYNIILLR